MVNITYIKFWQCTNGHTEQFVHGENVNEQQGMPWRPCSVKTCHRPMSLVSWRVNKDGKVLPSPVRRVVVEGVVVEKPAPKIRKPKAYLNRLLRKLGSRFEKVGNTKNLKTGDVLFMIGQKGEEDIPLPSGLILSRRHVMATASTRLGEPVIELLFVGVVGWTEEFRKALKSMKVPYTSSFIDAEQTVPPEPKPKKKKAKHKKKSMKKVVRKAQRGKRK